MSADELRTAYDRRRDASRAVAETPDDDPDIRSMVDAGLTGRQAEVYGFIFEYTRRNGIQPSLRELMERFAIASLNGVRCHLQSLARKGWIEPTEGGFRSIRFKLRPDGRPFRGFVLPED